jgi:AraC family transcriptional regulator
MSHTSPIQPTRYEDGRPMLLGGLRRHHPMAGAERTIPAQWAEFAALGELPGQRGAVAYGVICGSDRAAGTFEYMCAAEVASLDALPPEIGRMRVPAQRYAVFTHRGPAAGIRETWAAIWRDWLPRSGHQPANTPDFERYDERFDPRTGMGEFEIWFPIAMEGQERWAQGAPPSAGGEKG